jgi:hypothetical protein
MATEQPRQWQRNPHWCQRHWSPCLDQGRNGLMASILIMQRFVDEVVPDDVLRGGPTALNSYAENQLVPTCCKLGDEAMNEIWSKC